MSSEAATNLTEASGIQEAGRSAPQTYCGLPLPPPLRRDDFIPLNRVYLTGEENQEIRSVLDSPTIRLEAGGPKTKACEQMISSLFLHKPEVLLTGSCTQALEMCALLLGLSPGDEVIVPAFTFVSSANPFLNVGATIRFADVAADTLCVTTDTIRPVLSARTKAVVVVHYAGFECDVTAIRQLLDDFQVEHELNSRIRIIEDAAHALGARGSGGTRLGSRGDLACFSFHATKNAVAGEGGALVVNDTALSDAARICWEKGTNRHDFLRGRVDRYAWVAPGGSFGPSELTAAFLLPQLRAVHRICRYRVWVWNKYYRKLSPLERAGRLRLPPFLATEDVTFGLGWDETELPPRETTEQLRLIQPAHPGHIFWILLPTADIAQHMAAFARQRNVALCSHYVPLTTSPLGRQLRAKTPAVSDDCCVAESVAPRLLRLPLWFGLTDENIKHVVEVVEEGVASAIANNLYDGVLGHTLE